MIFSSFIFSLILAGTIVDLPIGAQPAGVKKLVDSEARRPQLLSVFDECRAHMRDTVLTQLKKPKDYRGTSRMLKLTHGQGDRRKRKVIWTRASVLEILSQVQRAVKKPVHSGILISSASREQVAQTIKKALGFELSGAALVMVLHSLYRNNRIATAAMTVKAQTGRLGLLKSDLALILSNPRYSLSLRWGKSLSQLSSDGTDYTRDRIPKYVVERVMLAYRHVINELVLRGYSPRYEQITTESGLNEMADILKLFEISFDPDPIKNVRKFIYYGMRIGGGPWEVLVEDARRYLMEDSFKFHRAGQELVNFLRTCRRRGIPLTSEAFRQSHAGVVGAAFKGMFGINPAKDYVADLIVYHFGSFEKALNDPAW